MILFRLVSLTLALLLGSFQVMAVPIITSILPAGGSIAGGTKVYIQGSGFDGAHEIKFGDYQVLQVYYISDSEILLFSPEASHAETVNVSVTTFEGTSAPSDLSKFYYIESYPPEITKISPSSGSIKGGNRVTIKGSNFNGTYLVRFGNQVANALMIGSDEMLVVAPAGVEFGTCNVTIHTFSGESKSSKVTQYTYTKGGWFD